MHPIVFFCWRVFAFFWYVLSPIRGTPEFWDHVFNRKKEKLVTVFAHSSKLDSIYFLIMSLLFNVPCRALCFYTFFDVPVLGSLLKKLGLIPVQPKRFGGPGNATQAIIDVLNEKEYFNFWISPPGGITKLQWQQGYYHIARATGAKVVLLGLDYQYWTTVMAAKRLNPEAMSVEVMEANLQHDMALISNLYPENTNPESIYIEGRSTSALDWLHLLFAAGAAAFAYRHSWRCTVAYAPLLLIRWALMDQFRKNYQRVYQRTTLDDRSHLKLRMAFEEDDYAQPLISATLFVLHFLLLYCVWGTVLPTTVASLLLSVEVISGTLFGASPPSKYDSYSRHARLWSIASIVLLLSCVCF